MIITDTFPQCGDCQLFHGCCKHVRGRSNATSTTPVKGCSYFLPRAIEIKVTYIPPATTLYRLADKGLVRRDPPEGGKRGPVAARYRPACSREAFEQAQIRAIVESLEVVHV